MSEDSMKVHILIGSRSTIVLAVVIEHPPKSCV